MRYARIYIDNSPELFTWLCKDDLQRGARVLVPFRDRKRIGIVISIDDIKPDFAVRPVLKVLDASFFPEHYIDVAEYITKKTMSSFVKVFSCMIMDEFLWKVNPEKRNILYCLGSQIDRSTDLQVRGQKQKLVVDTLLRKKKLSDDEIRKLASLSTIKSLIEKGILEKEELGLVNPWGSIDKKAKLHTLTKEQQSVYDAISESKKNQFLLWGVTGSGKTEIYRHIAKDILEKDKTAQVLFLVPEIALTEQFICSFQEVFGDTLALWHSKLSKGERVQEWLRVATGEARILIGARSACLIPMKNPKLIVVDEEHEWTYKNEFAPRFWTHDVVEEVVRLSGCQDNRKGDEGMLILGSATPSLRSLKKVEEKKYELLRLKKRVNSDVLPRIDIVDLKNEAKKGNYTALSQTLLQDMHEKLKNKEQIVLFLNKRGMAGSAQCKDCGYTYECPNCSYNLKLHEKGNRSLLMCHVCGYMQGLPESCVECGMEQYVFRGWGTQQVEKQLEKLFPDAKIARADRDSVSGKYDFQKIYEAMHSRETDILLGTQMIAKGLDFAGVGLVGVLLADIGLGLPDFAAEERVFQLMVQVAGRAGRRNQPSHIVVQTFQPTEPLFQYLQKYKIDEFYDVLKKQRKGLKMPPYGSIAKSTFSEITKKQASDKAQKLEEFLKGLENKRFPGLQVNVAPAFFPRSHNKYHWHVFIEHNDSKILFETLRKIPKDILGKIDTDPVSLL